MDAKVSAEMAKFLHNYLPLWEFLVDNKVSLLVTMGEEETLTVSGALSESDQSKRKSVLRRTVTRAAQIVKKTARCVECGIGHKEFQDGSSRNDKLSRLQTEHKIALCCGGTHSSDNIQAMCETCHKLKTAEDVAMQRKWQEAFSLEGAADRARDVGKGECFPNKKKKNGFFPEKTTIPPSPF